jgi:hypothetical protein
VSVTLNALRESFRVDLGRVAPWTAALRALPVIALFAIGLGAENPRTALTLGVGANLVAVISLVGSGRFASVLLFADVGGLAVATFVGSATAANPVAHLTLLAVWSFGAGLLVALGLGPASAGVQSLIAFIVFGRFVEAPVGALSLGALVTEGAMVESIFLLLLHLPPTLRTQRAALGDAFRRLAERAADAPRSPQVATGAAFDQAAALVASDGLFGRDDVRTWRSLIDEVRRMRLELSALAGLRRRLGATTPRDPCPADHARGSRAGRARDTGRPAAASWVDDLVR